MDDISYKRELNHNYMVIRSGGGDLSDRFEYRMMTENRIGKLLPCRQRQLDGESWLYYDISSLQPVKRLYESRKLDLHELGRIVHAVADIQEDLGEYLMDEQGLLLNADMLFTDIETEELYFCYDPGHQDAGRRYAELADFFLENVDHGQEPAVNAAYQFYKMTKSDHFVLSSFLPYLEKELTHSASRTDPYERAGAAAWQNDPQESVPARNPLQETASVRNPFREAAPARNPSKEAFPARGPLKENASARNLFRDAASARTPPQEAAPPSGNMPASKRRRPAFRLFRKRKQKLSRSEAGSGQAGGRQEWPSQVWDSYVEQLDLTGSGETVYFADLDGPARAPRGIPCLWEEGSDRFFPLDDLPVTVGKLKGKAGILLTDSSVSRLHARFEAAGSGLLIRDLNSRNGTLVNGRKLSPDETAELKEGDALQFGRERFRYGFLDSKLIK